jgi:hypothetical protein
LRLRLLTDTETETGEETDTEFDVVFTLTVDVVCACVRSDEETGEPFAPKFVFLALCTPASRIPCRPTLLFDALSMAALEQKGHAK